MHADIVASWAGKCPKCGAEADARAGRDRGNDRLRLPMHSEITATWAASCPKCGMTRYRATGTGAVADFGEVPAENATCASPWRPRPHTRRKASSGKTTWFEVNRMTTPQNMRWKLVDQESGAENAEIDWTFRVGDQVKLRLVNEMDSDHPMPHPFHARGRSLYSSSRS